MLIGLAAALCALLATPAGAAAPAAPRASPPGDADRRGAIAIVTTPARAGNATPRGRQRRRAGSAVKCPPRLLGMMSDVAGCGPFGSHRHRPVPRWHPPAARPGPMRASCLRKQCVKHDPRRQAPLDSPIRRRDIA
ncbi:hypothetical protein [Burkholderia glumae]|uniref:hypothetical protein n=1 Tax=Burkholderia glumae TaxID=337 RepID=UPI002660106D|nr:hypothetical protein [Burkholderia glumae]